MGSRYRRTGSIFHTQKIRRGIDGKETGNCSGVILNKENTMERKSHLQRHCEKCHLYVGLIGMCKAECPHEDSLRVAAMKDDKNAKRRSKAIKS